MQAFNWECHSIRDQSRKPAWLQMLADKADAIADAGITAVWLPPPCQAISDEVRTDNVHGGIAPRANTKRLLLEQHGRVATAGASAISDLVCALAL